MKVTIINGSPKKENSSSEVLIKELLTMLEEETVIINVRHPKAEIAQEVKEAEVLVFAMPLYVDSVPSQLLEYLTRLETELQGRNIKVYAMVNCGFFEAVQNRWALEIMENWCDRAGLQWGQGIGVGGGGMLPSLANMPAGRGPRKPLSKALQELAENIKNKGSDKNLFVSPAFPRRLYKAAAEMGWRKLIRANGLKPKDLSARP